MKTFNMYTYRHSCIYMYTHLNACYICIHTNVKVYVYVLMHA